MLASGISSSAGELHLEGKWNNWTKKIWLMLSGDIAAGGSSAKLTAWHPEHYLFEAGELGADCK